jgi:subtilase family serine protease
MSSPARLLFGTAALVALAACSANDSSNPAITAPDNSSLSASSTGQTMRYLNARVCPGSVVGTARCHSWVRVDPSGRPVTNTTPRGYGPADLQSAYNLPSTTGSTWSWNGKTIAIVDAYDAPTAEQDLATYRSYFKLPPCSTANGCFRKVNQTGGTTPPAANASWAQEISLDLDMASAICPSCKIVLVEASSNSLVNLYTAVDQAANMGATVISNSYGGPEYSGETNDEIHYNHSGIAITVSSGDNGYGVEFPASSRFVTAVGGTSLQKASNSRGWTETVWTGAGSGCSAYITKPTWQSDACARRTVADVSAIADPNTGVAVYDSYAYRGASGWLVFGGTSVAAPVIAGVYALGGAGSATAQTLYTSNAFFDVTSGSNGSCGGSYLCTGVIGYDGPTGLGTPNGVSAF